MKVKDAIIISNKDLQSYLLSSRFIIRERLNKSFKKDKVYRLVGQIDGKLVLIEQKFTKKGEYLLIG